MFHLLLFGLYILLIPLALGCVWADTYKINKLHLKLIYSYVIGFFVLLALYEIIEIPLVQIHYSFTNSCVIVFVLSIVLSLLCVALHRKRIKDVAGSLRQIKPLDYIRKLNSYELLYLAGALGLFLYQLYHTYFYQINQWSYDDESYVAWAAEAIYYNKAFPGIMIDPKRATQMALFEPAFFAKIANVHVATMMHTILPVLYLAMAYAVVYLLATIWIESRENRLIFMILVQLLYVYGYYSHYSLTFRMLGPIWNGKGVLAVVLNPLLMLIVILAMKVGYSNKIAVLMMIMSVAAVSLTLGGVISIMAFTCIIIIVHVIKNRNKQALKCALYIAWTGIFPMACALYYLIATR